MEWVRPGWASSMLPGGCPICLATGPWARRTQSASTLLPLPHFRSGQSLRWFCRGLLAQPPQPSEEHGQAQATRAVSLAAGTLQF